jgi:hypothetical protein
VEVLERWKSEVRQELVATVCTQIERVEAVKDTGKDGNGILQFLVRRENKDLKVRCVC